MKRKKAYIFVILAIVILFIFFNVKYEKGAEAGSWGINRSVNWRWNLEF